MATATLKTSGYLNPTTATGGASCDGNLPAISVTAGNLLVVFLGSNKNTGTTTNWMSCSSAGYTFTQRVEGSQAGDFTAAAAVWTAPIPSTNASLVVAVADSINTYGLMYAVYEVSGHDAGTPTGGTASTAGYTVDGVLTLTLSVAPASDDITLGFVFLDADNATTKSIDVGSGFTEDFDYTDAAWYSLAQAQQRTGSTSTSVPWADIKPAGYSGSTYSSAAVAVVIKNGTAVTTALPHMAYRNTPFTPQYAGVR
jgi:hypothetical protein